MVKDKETVKYSDIWELDHKYEFLMGALVRVGVLNKYFKTFNYKLELSTTIRMCCITMAEHRSITRVTRKAGDDNITIQYGDKKTTH